MSETFNTGQSSRERFNDIYKNLDERRERVFRDKSLTDDEIIDQMQEVDQLKVSHILEEHKQNDETLTSPDDLEKRLLDVASGDFYTDIQPNTSVYQKVSGRDVEEENEMCLTLDSMTCTRDSIVRFSVCVTEPYKSGDFHVEHAGVIEVDLIHKRVHTVLAPEGIAMERPRTLRPVYADLDSLKRNAIHALTNLIEPTKHIPTAYKGGDAKAVNERREGGLTKIEAERVSTLKCRKRVFRGIEDLGTLPDKLSSLEQSWSEQEREVITEEEVDGELHFEIYVRGLDGTYTLLNQRPTIRDGFRIQSELEEMFVRNTITDATIICSGTWVDRYLRNLEPAPSPTAHTRRLKGRVILVLPREVEEDVRVLQEKIRTSGISSLDDDEREDLKTILATDEDGLVQLFSAGGIIYKSDTFSPGSIVSAPSKPNNYYYTQGV